MSIEELRKLLNQIWSSETCVSSLKDNWSSDNPSLGQCAITSLIVNDFFGGKIMRCMTSTGSHYYNLINGEIVDLTVEQFKGEVPQYKEGTERTRDYLLSNLDTKNRYELLLNNLNQINCKKFKLIDENGNQYPIWV